MSKILLILLSVTFISCGDLFENQGEEQAGTGNGLGRIIRYAPQTITTNEESAIDDINSALEYKTSVLMGDLDRYNFQYSVTSKECYQGTLSGGLSKQLDGWNFFMASNGSFPATSYREIKTFETAKEGSIFHPFYKYKKDQIALSPGEFQQIAILENTNKRISYTITNAKRMADGEHHSIKEATFTITKANNSTKGIVIGKKLVGVCSDQSDRYEVTENLQAVQKSGLSLSF